MSTIDLIFIWLLFVSTSLLAYLLGYLRGKKGQKEVIKYIYKQEESTPKKRGFASEDITITNKEKTKRYRVN